VSIPRPFFTSHLELGPLPSAAGSARGHARAILQEWGFGDEDFSETVHLVVSELTTNAVSATRILDTPLPMSVRLWLQGNRKRVLVTVWDANPNPPILTKDVPTDAENGRGLMLVDALAAQWGWYEPPELGGKCVWCEIARPSPVRE
jgi:anti-sigma regulatory factor (Ser/Thr protein kinase)